MLRRTISATSPVLALPGPACAPLVRLAMSSSCASEDADKAQSPDVEKQDPTLEKQHHGRINEFPKVEDGEVYRPHSEKHSKWYQRLLHAGAEENGIKPVPVEGRTNTQYSNLFTVFFTGLLCLLPYVLSRPLYLRFSLRGLDAKRRLSLPTGLLATLEFGMSLRDAALVIIFFAMLACIPPAFMCIGGLQTGIRQVVQARYSFG